MRGFPAATSNGDDGNGNRAFFSFFSFFSKKDINGASSGVKCSWLCTTKVDKVNYGSRALNLTIHGFLNLDVCRVKVTYFQNMMYD